MPSSGMWLKMNASVSRRVRSRLCCIDLRLWSSDCISLWYRKPYFAHTTKAGQSYLARRRIERLQRSSVLRSCCGTWRRVALDLGSVHFGVVGDFSSHNAFALSGRKPLCTNFKGAALLREKSVRSLTRSKRLPQCAGT